MGLGKYEMKEVSELHLRDAADELMYADGQDGEPDLSRPVRAHVYGPGTKQFAKAQTASNNRRVAKMQRKGKAELSPDEELQDRVEFAVGVTRALENVESDHGAVGEDLFREVYGNLKLSFMRDQIEAHARNTANFTQSSTAK